jgi:hypothetical protein
MREEHWKPVPVEGYEDLYSVSDLGRVRNEGTGRTLKPYIARQDARPGRSGRSGQDHLGVKLNASRDGRRVGKNVYVHLLVLRAFAETPKSGQIARHGKGGSQDNRYPENLCWGTREENEADKHRDGTANRTTPRKLDDNTAKEIHVLKARGWTNMGLAEKFNVTRSAIQHVLAGRTYRHIWREFNA